jgi:hypothetical protein
VSTQGQSAAAEARLEKDAIGLAPVLFQSITHMAPAAAVAFSIIFAVTYAGGATPLAVLLALVACLFVAISIGQLAKHLGVLRRVGVHAGGAAGRAASVPDLRECDLGLSEQPFHAHVGVGAAGGHRGLGAGLPRGAALDGGGRRDGRVRDRL